MEAVGLQGKSRIALVIGEGDITRGEAGDDGSTGNNLTSYGFDKLLRQVAGDSTIKGVVVRIDSPGGEQVASDEIWRQMNLLSKKKPLVFSMSDLAASGGYYIAMTGDPIVAYPETLTGSIGVVFGKPNLHGLYDKLGITKDAVQRGKHAGIDSDYASLTPDERQILRDGIDESYQGFRRQGGGRRGAAASTTSSRWRRGAYGWARRPRRGGWWTNWAASTRAIELVKKKAHIPAGEKVSLVMYPPRRSLLDIVMRRPQDDMLESKLAQVFGRMPFHAWMKGGFLRMMPYWVEVR